MAFNKMYFLGRILVFFAKGFITGSRVHISEKEKK